MSFMSGPEEKQSQPEKTEHVDERLNNIAYSLGYFLGNTRLRAQHFAQAFREGNVESNHIHQEPVEAQREPLEQQMETNSIITEYAATPRQPEPTGTSKAEDMIEIVGIQLDTLFTVSRILMRRTVARIREDVEDIWVESQMLRKRQRRRRLER
ncbi:hypothetical protein [Ktedonobacter racemifer]|nr:hypothetical protein [Ktedonobacter racemifer]